MTIYGKLNNLNFPVIILHEIKTNSLDFAGLNLARYLMVRTV